MDYDRMMAYINEHTTNVPVSVLVPGSVTVNMIYLPKVGYILDLFMMLEIITTSRLTKIFAFQFSCGKFVRLEWDPRCPVSLLKV